MYIMKREIWYPCEDWAMWTDHSYEYANLEDMLIFSIFQYAKLLPNFLFDV